VHPYNKIIPHEIIARVCVDIHMNAVLTFNKNVNTKIKTSADHKIRNALPICKSVPLHPKITGSTGSTQGARTERIHARNEMRRSDIIITN
jgi:hypothetical protein